jgi:multiple sugar transport system ATP-binding protein
VAAGRSAAAAGHTQKHLQNIERGIGEVNGARPESAGSYGRGMRYQGITFPSREFLPAKKNDKTQERKSMNEGAVEIKDLVKTYVDDRGRPTFTGVKNISLHIDNGEFMVLVGPSGCGKSTTLRMVAGLEKISSGTISIGGRVVNELEPKDRGIAMVFQNYALYPHMTLYNNMAFGLQLAKKKKEFISEIVGRTAKALGLDHMLDRKPNVLSGGQRQRVALGRAIVRSPIVFLFDEPLSNLDAKMRVQMRSEISRLHAELGSIIQ